MTNATATRMALYRLENLESGLTYYIEAKSSDGALEALAHEKGYDSLAAANADGECLDGIYCVDDVTGLM